MLKGSVRPLRYGQNGFRAEPSILIFGRTPISTEQLTPYGPAFQPVTGKQTENGGPYRYEAVTGVRNRPERGKRSLAVRVVVGGRFLHRTAGGTGEYRRGPMSVEATA